MQTFLRFRRDRFNRSSILSKYAAKNRRGVSFIQLGIKLWLVFLCLLFVPLIPCPICAKRYFLCSYTNYDAVYHRFTRNNEVEIKKQKENQRS